MYDKVSSSWKSITGGVNHFSLLNTAVVTDGIRRGEIYEFSYRAWNINGAGPWSLSSYIRAA